MDRTCPHCDPITSTSILRHLLEETTHFRVVCDAHPLKEGHILIIPKKHTVCIGACADEVFAEFLPLYLQSERFLRESYGSVSAFEHGVVGQTVPHAHVHLLPYAGAPEAIVPEGSDHLTTLKHLSDLRSAFTKDGQYLFFSMGERSFFVDTELGVPRFFRDRFAKALGRSERGDWKAMEDDAALMALAQGEIEKLKNRFTQDTRTLL